jgi:hypothetical protein
MTQAATPRGVVLTFTCAVSLPTKYLMTFRSNLITEYLEGPKSLQGSDGCNSACAANTAPDPNNDPNCCTGRYDTSSTCTPEGVQFYSYFSKCRPVSYLL